MSVSEQEFSALKLAVATNAKSLQGAIEEIHTDKTTFQSQIATLSKKNKETAKQIVSFRNLFSEYREAIIADINEGVLNDRICAVERKFSKLRESMEQNVKKMTEMKEETNEKLDQVNLMMENMEDTLNQFQQMKKEMSKLKDKNEELENNINELNQKLDEANETISSHTNTIEELQSAVENAEKDREAIREEYSKSLKKEIKNLNEGLSQQDQQNYDSLLKMIEKIKSKDQEQDEDLKQINQNLEVVQELVDNFKDFQDFKEQVQNLTEEIRSDVQKETKETFSNFDNRVSKVEKENKSILETQNNHLNMITTNQKAIEKLNIKIKEIDSISVEQQNHEKSINEINDNIEQITSAIKELRKTVKHNKESVETTVREEITQITTTVQEITSSSERLKAHTKNSINEMNTIIVNLQTGIASIQKDTKADIGLIKQSNDILVEDIKKQGTASQQAIQQALDRINKELEEFKSVLNDQMEKSNQTVIDRVNKVENDFGSFKGDDGLDLKQIIINMKTIKNDLQSNTTKFDERIKHVRSKIESSVQEQNKATYNEIQTLRDELNGTKVELVESINSTSKSHQQALSERASDLEKKLNVLVDTVNSNQSSNKKSFEDVNRKFEAIKQDNQQLVEQISGKFSDQKSMIAQCNQSITETNDIILQIQEGNKAQNKKTNHLINTSVKEINELINVNKSEQDSSNSDLIRKVKDLNEKISSLTQRANELQESISNCNGTIEQQNVEIDNKFSSLHKEMEDDMKILSKDINKEVGQIKITIESFKGDSDMDFPSLLESLKSLKQQVNQSLEKSEERLKRTRGKMDEIINNMQENIDTHEKELREELASAISSSESKLITNIQENIKTINSTNNEINKRINVFETTINSIKGDSSASIPSILNSITEIQSEILSKHRKIQKEITSVRSEFLAEQNSTKEDTQNTLNEINSRIDSLNQNIGSSTDELRDMIHSGDKKNSSKINSLLSEFSQFRAGSDYTFKQIADQTIELANAINGEEGLLKTTLAAFQQKVQGNISKMKADLKSTYGDNSVQIEAMQKEISGLTESTSDIKGKQASQYTEVLSLIKDQKKRLQTLSTENSTKFETITSSLKSELDKFKQSNKSNQDQNNQIIKDLEASFKDALASLNNKIRSKHQEVIQQIEGVSTTLNTKYSDMSQLQKQTEKNLEQLKADFEAHLSGRGEEENKLLDVVKSNFKSFKSKLEKTVTEELTSLSKIVNGVSNKTEEQITSMHNELSNDISVVKVKLDAITEGSDTTLKALSDSIETVQDKLADAMPLFNRRIKDTKNELKEIIDSSTKKTKERNTSILEQMEAFRSEINKAHEKITQEAETSTQQIKISFQQMKVESQNIFKDSISKLSHEFEELHQQTIDITSKNEIQMQALSTSIKTLGKKVSRAVEANTTLQNDIETLKTKLNTSLESNRNENTELYQRVKDKLATYDSQFKEQSSLLQQDMQSIKDITEKNSSQIDEAYSHFDNSYSKMKKVIEKLNTTMNEHYGEMKQSLYKVQTTSDDHSKMIAKIKNSISDIKETTTNEFTKMIAQVNELDNQLQKLTKDFNSSFTKQLTINRTDINEFKGNLDNLKHLLLHEIDIATTKVLNTTDKSFEEHSKELTKLKIAIQGLNDATNPIPSIHASIKDLESKMNLLQAKKIQQHLRESSLTGSNKRKRVSEYD